MEKTSDKNVLNYLVENGIIDLDVIQNDIEMKKDEQILANHKYEIYFSESDNRWHSYLPDDSKKNGRKPVAKTKLEDLKKAIIQHYKDLENRNLTVGQTFYAWLEEKKDEVVMGTINRYEQDFNRFLKCIENKKLKDYDDLNTINKLCLDKIKELKLDRKAFAKMKSLLIGMFKYGYRNKITTIDIEVAFRNMNFPANNFVKKVTDPSKMVFSYDELPNIEEFLVNSDHPIDLGILLLLKTGLRVGEISALEFKHFTPNGLYIEQMETKYKLNGKYHYEVVNHAKTECGTRTVLIPEHDMWILDKIKQTRGDNVYSGQRIKTDTFVFLDAYGDRASTYVFRNRLYRVCDKLFDNRKSPHKIRKTYCTMLLEAKLPEDLITKQVGHASIETTRKHYQYTREGMKEEQKRQALEREKLSKVAGL